MGNEIAVPNPPARDALELGKDSTASVGNNAIGVPTCTGCIALRVTCMTAQCAELRRDGVCQKQLWKLWRMFQ